MIGGFVQPTAGRVIIQGRDVTLLGPERRPTNMVFQGYGLFPHMTVQQNIAYGLRIAGLSRQVIETRLTEVMRLVRLEALSERSISQLSGGQQQRVALARALVMRPPVLLLDEPLAALDLKLRQAMQEELRRIHAEIGGTFVFVTHDQGEAMSLANRVAVMNEGHLLQVGSPEDIYGRPKSEFVATFIGEANLFPGERLSDVVQLRSGPRFVAGGRAGEVTVVVRPEAMAIDPPPDPNWATVRGTVADRVFLGPTVRITVHLADGARILVQAGDPSTVARYDVGAEVISRVAGQPSVDPSGLGVCSISNVWPQRVNSFGESPLWSATDQALYWVDVTKPAMRRYQPATGALETWAMAEDIGSIGHARAGTFVAGMRSGFYIVDPKNNQRRLLAALATDDRRLRLNDGKCDRAGRFWSGTLDDQELQPDRDALSARRRPSMHRDG